jgi:Uma2 family endonuclease
MMAVGVQEATSSQVAPVVVLPGPIYRLSVSQYLQMVDAGILTEDDRVELLEGVLVTKMGKKPPHVWAAGQSYDALLHLVPVGWCVFKEDPLVLDESTPEPDGMVVRGSRDDYKELLPRAADAALVVEVADSTLQRDREEKKRIYARAGIPVYWIINLVGLRIEVYADPTGPDALPDYRMRRDYGPDDEVPVVIEGREVGRLAVRDLLP